MDIERIQGTIEKHPTPRNRGPENVRQWDPLNLMHKLRALRNRFNQSILRFPGMRAMQLESMKRELRALAEHTVVNGVYFEHVVPEAVWEAYEAGTLELEGLNLYMEGHGGTGALLEDQSLSSSDEIGFRISKSLADMFPGARQVLLVDDMHSLLHQAAGSLNRPRGLHYTASSSPYTEEAREKFKEDIVARMKRREILREDSVAGTDYLLVSESAQQADVPNLVSLLESKGYIRRDGKEVWFVNSQADNPEFSEIRLANKEGEWLCVTLDATSFLKDKGLDKTYLVVLDLAFKAQQDQVWEILRVLGVNPLNYHNIFFDASRPPSEVARTIQEVMMRHKPTQTLARTG